LYKPQMIDEGDYGAIINLELLGMQKELQMEI
jgi:hypothetical protein